MARFDEIETFTAAPLNLISGISDMTLVADDGRLWLYTVTRGGGGLLALDVGAGLTLVDQQMTISGSRLPVPAGLHVVTAGTQATLFVTGSALPRATGYRMESDGSLGAEFQSKDSLAGVVAAQAVAQVAGSTFFFSARAEESLIHIYRLNPGGTQTAVSQFTLGTGLQGTNISALNALQIGGQLRLFALSRVTDEVVAFTIGTDGQLAETGRLGAAHGVGISNPTAMERVVVGGETFLVVGSATSSSLSVIAVSAEGELTLVDHVIDTLNTRFAGVGAITTVTVGDRGYIIAGGGDEGLTLFAVLPGGRLVLIATALQAPGQALSNITAITAHVVNGRIELFVAGEGSGITRMVLDPGSLAPIQRGGSGADTLDGGAGGDLLDGGAGADQLRGSAGNDILIDGGGSDTLWGGAGEDLFVLMADGASDQIGDFQVGIDRIDLTAWGRVYDLSALGFEATATGAILTFRGERLTIVTGNGQPLSLTQLSAEALFGLWHDVPTGGGSATESSDNDDVQAGGAGNDRLAGSNGADSIDGGDGVDTVDYSGWGAGLLVDLLFGGANSGFAAGDVLTSIEGLIGGAGDDILRGSFGDDALQGGGGQDVLSGRLGNDTLSGGDGDDVLAGGAGSDRLEGGGGRDRISYADATAAVALSLRRAEGTAGDAAGDSYFQIEDVTGSAFNDTITGDAFANSLDGGAGADHLVAREGNDTLSGGVGADTLDGGDGVDLADYSGAETGLVIDLSQSGLNAGAAAGDVLVSIEAVLGGRGHDALRGTAGADHLRGGAGNDTLAGRGGADTLDGGEGFDTADFSEASAPVVLDLQSVDGLVMTGIERIVGSRFVDRLSGNAGANHLAGQDGNDRIEGRGGNDVLEGGAGQDTLLGGAGADRLSGGAGIDLADYADAATGLRIDLLFAALSNGEAAGDVLVEIEVVAGSGFADLISGAHGADSLRGRSGADTLLGRGGNDQLEGGTGRDRLHGGAGADTLIGDLDHDVASYAMGTAPVTVDLAFGQFNTGDAAGDVFIGIEEIEGSQGNDLLAGDGADNVLGGQGGDDVLSGRGGNDTLRGDAGADRFFGGDGFDLADYSTDRSGLTLDLADAGRNTGLAAGDLHSGVEAFAGGRGGDRLAGDAAQNWLYGNSGQDGLSGRAGNDHLFGGAGTDSLAGGLGADTLDGGSGSDTADYSDAATGVRADLAEAWRNLGEASGDVFLFIENLEGSDLGDTLGGDGLANVLTGGGGQDSLTGRAGHDRLYGGEGSDTLAGGSGNDLLAGGAGADTLRYDGGADRVVGFAWWLDRLEISAALAGDRTAADLAAMAVVQGSALVLDFGFGNRLRLEGLTDPDVLIGALFVF